MTAREIAIIAIACTLAGYGIGRWKPTSRETKQDPPAREIRHQTGEVTLERTNEKPPEPLPAPEKTAARTRTIILDLEPIEKKSRVQLDIVTLKDGTQRATVKGEAIKGGLDFALELPTPATVHKWTVAGTWDGKTPGIMVTRKTGRIVVGTLAEKNSVRIIVGVQF